MIAPTPVLKPVTFNSPDAMGSSLGSLRTKTSVFSMSYGIDWCMRGNRRDTYKCVLAPDRPPLPPSSWLRQYYRPR